VSWLTKLLPPRIKSTPGVRKTPVPEGLWIKCPSCEAVLYRTDLEKNLMVCPKCGHHTRVGARERIEQLLDQEGRFEIGSEVVPVDSLKFKDQKKYPERLEAALDETGEMDALIVMQGSIRSVPVVLAAFEFEFMGGSMGSVVGERFARGVRVAYENRVPFVCVSASGRCAHAGRREFAVPDGEDHRRAAGAQQGAAAVRHDPHRSDDGRRLRVVCIRCRSRPGRAWRADRIRGPARDRADGARKAARGLPACGIPDGEGRARPDRRPSGSCATSSRDCLRC
jgi:hypothetical protein